LGLKKLKRFQFSTFDIENVLNDLNDKLERLAIFADDIISIQEFRSDLSDRVDVVIWYKIGRL
jgi:hypothetical protein